MLDTTLETRRLADSLTDNLHRYILNHRAADSSRFLDYQGPSYPRTELQARQNPQVWTGGAVLARDRDCGEYAGFIPE